MPMYRYIRQVKNQEDPMKNEPRNSIKDQLLKQELYKELQKILDGKN